MEKLLEELAKYNGYRKGDKTGPYYIIIDEKGKVSLMSFLPKEVSYDERIGNTDSIPALVRKLEEINKQMLYITEHPVDLNKALFSVDEQD